MKSLRSIFGAVMIVALLALLFHQHDARDGPDARAKCAAASWHSGAVHHATVRVELSAPTRQIVSVACDALSVAAQVFPNAALPRGPPSTGA